MSTPQSKDASFASTLSPYGPVHVSIGTTVVKVVSVNVKILCNRNNPQLTYQVLSLRVMLTLNDEVLYLQFIITLIQLIIAVNF
jgi:hypothetical protein